MKSRVWMIAALAAAAVGWAGLGSAGIVGSHHDMTSAESQVNAGADPLNTTEVCVFCHTPHGADTSAAVPLWNKGLPSSASFTTYDQLGTSTLDGEVLSVGSVSLACLSCHDGTQAMDSVINAPGKDGFVPGGAPIAGNVLMTNDLDQLAPVLGTDLQDDHPVGVEYAGGACAGATADCDPAAATTGDADFVTAQYDTVNGQNVFWVDVAGGTADRREKTDMILYTRTFTAGAGPSVECGSCHDPHNDAEQPLMFLRTDNAGSGVCLACHIK